MTQSVKQEKRIAAAVEKVIQDHKTTVREQQEAETRKATMREAESNERTDLKEQLTHLNDTTTQLQKEYALEDRTTLENAHITPTTLRDTAEYFLKSQEKGFKMGIFASKKKTSEEQERRLNQFLNDLTTSFETNI